MNPLVEMVSEVFAAEGVLARCDPSFQPRAGQIEMARAVALTMSEGGALVVEAGTGVGKTFAYLVPALLSGERVLLSTATKALQDQLFARDIPRLVAALGVPVRLALLKGRGSYLCRYRLEIARQDGGASDRGVARVLAKVEQWAVATNSGDMAELPGLDERSPVLPLVTSTRENCLGSECPRFKGCHVYQARRRALESDVVVINHHLFFADVAVRESGMAQLLPSAGVVVFDEAHQINEIGVQFLGLRLSTGQVLEYARDVGVVGHQLARGLADWQRLARGLECAAQLLLGSVQDVPSGSKLRWTQAQPEDVAASLWMSSLRQVAVACAQVQEALDVVSETAPDFGRLYERGSELLARIAHFSAPAGPEVVRWLDVGTQLRLMESPLDISQAMRSRLLTTETEAAAGAGGASDMYAWDDPSEPVPAEKVVESPKRAWIFTSATLGHDDRLTWFTQRAGLQDAQVLQVASPFDYAQQAAWYVPRELPVPADPAHSQALALWVAAAAQSLGGRTLVLTTTLKAMRAVGEVLQARFSTQSAVEVLVQGDWPKRYLMERFRAANAQDQPGCILVASATFWEGFDVPGDALQLVVIDKLPFPPPGDPMVEARTRQVLAQGGTAFKSFALPEAAVALKQGAGRLIRHENDRGILVIGDTRLVTTGYGKRLIAALPPMRRLDSEAEFQLALQWLTKASTTDPLSP